mmetsp:Transcript_11818/g.25918  ORF Transcript_11818/g.25918 Transcript_11818/m.25918 type:complete len:98 (-) Transcript_11818:895-1188(-)
MVQNTHTSEVVLNSAIEEQKKMQSEIAPATSGKKAMAKAKEVTSVFSQGMSALRERGERLEKLDNKTAQLQSDASNYAQTAKQLKEKNQKKSKFFGL